METIFHKNLSQKIKELPENLVEKVSDYIDFLLYKTERDWFDSMNEEQRKDINQGLEDIKNGNVHSHNAVMEEMTQYINSKKR